MAFGIAVAIAKHLAGRKPLDKSVRGMDGRAGTRDLQRDGGPDGLLTARSDLK